MYFWKAWQSKSLVYSNNETYATHLYENKNEIKISEVEPMYIVNNEHNLISK